MKWIVVVLVFLLPTSVATAQNSEAMLSLGRMPWQAYVGAGCSVKAIPHSTGIGGYLFNCNGEGEAFPHISLQNTGRHDWRGFTRLRLKLRLTSHDPGVQAGGEDVTVILSDAKTRHENMPGDPMVQQVISKFKLHVGGWQTVDLNLGSVRRSDVQGLDIYAYEMPYAYRHQFEIQLAQAMLIGPGSGQICFDSHTFNANALRGASGTAVGSVTTPDGLELQVGKNGGIRRWFINGTRYGSGRNQVSGIMLRDAAANTVPVTAGGNVSSQAGRIVQDSVLDKLGLKIHAIYAAKGNRITVNGTVTNLRRGNRAVTVYFGVPVNLLNWQWGDGLDKSSQPFRHLYSAPTLEDRLTGYPICALSAPGTDAGLALGIRLDQPAIYRFVINPHQRLLYVAFNFSLTNGIRRGKHASARFSLMTYRCDPQWGLRSALQRYYHFFPQFFTDRVKFGGGWGFHRGAGKTPKKYISGGYRFDWGATEKDAKWNQEHGVLNLLYIEPEFLQFSMADYQKPTYQRAMKRLAALGREDGAAWKKFMRLPYTQGGCGHFWSHQYSGMDLRPFLAKLIGAALTSGIYNVDDKLILGLSGGRAWIGGDGVGAMIPCDLNPKIPEGMGVFDWEHCMVPNAKAFRAATGLAADGFALDSFNTGPNDYRRSDLKYSTYPLSFNPSNDKPMIPATFSTVEWLRWITSICHRRKQVLMANISNKVTFSAPYIDIFGNESPAVRHPALLRALAYHRPITYLPYTNQPKDGVQYNLLWDDYPGLGIKLSVLAPMIPVLDKLYRSGWEPVTWAHSNRPAINIERFGSGISCYLSLYNPTNKAVKAQVDVDWKHLGIRRGKVRMIFPEKQYLPQADAGFSIVMQPEATIVVSLH